MSVARTARHWGADAVMGVGWKLRYVRRASQPVDLDPAGDRAPVLLIPGVHETWQFMRPIGLRLQAAGHPVHALPGLGFNVAPIPDSAALAQRYVDDTGLEGVIVVGHSKGGLIGKHMMAVDDSSGRVARVIAITSPFSGSSLARYSPATSLRAFMPSNPTLAALAAERDINSRITSIYGEFDPMIPVRSFLDGATNIELPIVGHFRVLTHPDVLSVVERVAAGE